jgi:hypothetical protein
VFPAGVQLILILCTCGCLFVHKIKNACVARIINPQCQLTGLCVYAAADS